MPSRRDLTTILIFAGVVGGLGGLGLILRLSLGGPQPVAAAPEPAWSLAADDPLLGRRAFVHCQGCHQADGAGIPGLFPPLAGNPRLLGPADPLIRISLHGYDSGGVLWNEVMPGLADRLADHELAAALSYARSAWGNAAPAIGAATVAAVRRAEVLRSRPWTPGELPPPSAP